MIVHCLSKRLTVKSPKVLLYAKQSRSLLVNNRIQTAVDNNYIDSTQSLDNMASVESTVKRRSGRLSVLAETEALPKKAKIEDEALESNTRLKKPKASRTAKPKANKTKSNDESSEKPAKPVKQTSDKDVLSVVHDDGKARCWPSADPKSKHYHDTEWARPMHYFPDSIKSFVPHRPAEQSTNQSNNPSANSSSSSESVHPDAESEKEYHVKLNRLFAILCLEQLQAGLSWSLIMKRWDQFFDAMDQFDVELVAKYSDDDVERLMHSDGMIKNKIKIESMIHNAKLIKTMEDNQRGSFYQLIWQFHFPSTTKQSIDQSTDEATKQSTNQTSKSSKSTKSKKASPSDLHTIHQFERVLESGTHLSSWMRSDFKTKAIDRITSDGVHPSKTVHMLTKAMKSAGVKFMGETCCLNFMQAAGFVNHHAHGCFAFDECEQEYQQLETIYRQLEQLHPKPSSHVDQDDD